MILKKINKEEISDKKHIWDANYKIIHDDILCEHHFRSLHLCVRRVVAVQTSLETRLTSGRADNDSISILGPTVP